MNLYCGHNPDSDLDTICPQCGRSFIKRPYFAYLFVVIILLIIYYLHPIPINELLLFTFLGFSWFLLSIILRNRNNELLKGLMISIPTIFLIIFTSEYTLSFLIGVKSLLIVISTILLCIPIVSAIYLGFKDAIFFNQINKGSLWIVLSFILSFCLTLLHYSLDYFSTMLELNINSIFYQNLVYYVELIYNYRQSLFAVILILVSIISIANSLIKELRVKTFNIPNPASSTTSIGISLMKGIENIFRVIFGSINISIDLAKQILVIIFSEVYNLVKDSIIRSILIIIRLFRVGIIAFLSYLTLLVITRLTNFIKILWESDNFWSVDSLQWVSFAIYCLLYFCILWIISMATYKKWKEFSNEVISIKRIFTSFFGSFEDAYIAFKSITISTIMFLFYYALTFLGAWIIINPVHYLFNLPQPSPIGILFTLSISLILIFGLLKVVFK